MSNQAYGFKKDSRFAKHNDIADIYNQFLERADQGEEVDVDEEIAAAKMVWGKEPLTVNQRWIKQAKGTYDFFLNREPWGKAPRQQAVILKRAGKQVLTIDPTRG
jgi:hypothetical protein